jgi:hypothetical protein
MFFKVSPLTNWITRLLIQTLSLVGHSPRDGTHEQIELNCSLKQEVKAYEVSLDL